MASDDELVDFEGSDYEIGSDYEELEDDDDPNAFDPSKWQETLRDPAKGASSAEQQASMSEGMSYKSCKLKSEETRGSFNSGASDISRDEKSVSCGKNQDSISATGSAFASKDGAESGEIDDARNHKEEETAVAQFSSSSHLSGDAGQIENKLREHSNPDLEDGELDETAMPQNYNFDGEEQDKDETDERERKRRKDDVTVTTSIKKDDAKVLEDINKHHCSVGSDKIKENIHGLNVAGIRGGNVKTMDIGLGGFAPSIMGPGRPFLPLGFCYLSQGFNPFPAHGRPHVHLQEFLAQEHLLRAHALHIENLAAATRSSLVRPLGPASIHPFLGIDNFRPRSHMPKHFSQPPHSAELMLGHMDNFVRPQRSTFGAGRAPTSVVKPRGRSEASAFSREFNWPAPPVSGGFQHPKRGHSRGRGLRNGVWGVMGPLGDVHGGLGSPGLPLHPQGTMTHLTDEIEFYQTGMIGSLPERNFPFNEFDARWKIEKERMVRHGSSPIGPGEHDATSGKISDSNQESVKDTTKKTEEVKSFAAHEGPISASLSTQKGSTPSQIKDRVPDVIPSSNSTVGSNVIKLFKPVQKSRTLTVSGLPEDTPMSTVVEVFEKLGKITDFKKGEKGGTFTIIYSSETEAVTAKRNLHRSFLAGKQITVDYVYH